MNATIRQLRKELGIAKYERECRLTSENGRMKKAWRVPGTPEHGHHTMLEYEMQRREKRMAEAPHTS